jgi:type IV pilus assembly protein PilA
LPHSGRFVESIEVVSGMIVITYGGEANDAVAGSVLAIVPALDSSRTLAWVCGYGRAPPGFEVAFEGHAGYTAINERYIPSACRSSP